MGSECSDSHITFDIGEKKEHPKKQVRRRPAFGSLGAEHSRVTDKKYGNSGI